MLLDEFRMAALIGIPISRYRIDRAKGKPANACQCEGRRGAISRSAVIASRKLAAAARRDRRLAPGYFELTAMCRSAWWLWLLELLRASDRAEPRWLRDSLLAMERPELPEPLPWTAISRVRSPVGKA